MSSAAAAIKNFNRFGVPSLSGRVGNAPFSPFLDGYTKNLLEKQTILLYNKARLPTGPLFAE